ncbi:MAG: glycosyltransferase family 4 protein [Candidatus Manganitrophaceae bacterium]
MGNQIVLIGPTPPPYNGQSVAFQMLIEGLRERNIPHAIIDTSTKKKIESGAVTLGRIVEYAVIMMKYLRRTMGGRKTVYITISQLRAGFFRDLAVICFARLKGHRIVCHLHGGNYDRFYAAQPPWLRWLIRRAMLMADAILVLGEGLRAMFEFEPRLKGRVHVVPNGLPVELETECVPKSLPDDSSGPIRLLYLSNLIESKGYLDLLKAVDLLVHKEGLNVECHFCGLFRANKSDDMLVKNPEHAREHFEDFIRAHQLQGHVFYHGVVLREEKSVLLKEAHFFVLSTYYDREGQPVSIIEAMAYGTVVIATRYRAIPDLIIEGKTGYFIPPREPEAIAKKVVETVADKERYREMSRETVRHFRSRFTRDQHLRRIIPFLHGDHFEIISNG